MLGGPDSNSMKETPDVQHISLPSSGGADAVEGGGPDDHVLHVGIRGRQRRPPAALRQGQEAAVGRRGAARLVPRGGSRQPDGPRRQDHRDLRHRPLEPADRQGARPRPAQPAGPYALAVHARRAGRPHRDVEDRPDRAEHRGEVLRRDPGHGRGAARRGVCAAAAREGQARLPDHAHPGAPAREHHHGPALGHDLSRHAGADRGPGARGLPAHPGLVVEHARRRGQRLRHAGRGAARRLRPDRPARLLSRI